MRYINIVSAVTLWVLIRGFGNAGGTVTLLTAAAMQPIATYRTAAECNKIAKGLLNGLRQGGTDANVLCLPTGKSDPVRRQKR